MGRPCAWDDGNESLSQIPDLAHANILPRPYAYWHTYTETFPSLGAPSLRRPFLLVSDLATKGTLDEVSIDTECENPRMSSYQSDIVLIKAPAVNAD